MELQQYITAHTLRLETSRRGGGIEIDAAEYLQIPWAKMTAYQNYLGGGMLGSVQSSWNRNIQEGVATNKAKRIKLDRLAEALKRYFHDLTNELAGDYDDWSASSYDDNQNRSESAY